MVKWFPPNGYTGKFRHIDALTQKLAALQNVVHELRVRLPLEACYLGRQESFTFRAQIVEAEVPG